MGPWALFQELIRIIRWVDVLDIFLVTLIVYRVLLLIKGTRTVQIMVGFVFLGLVFWLANKFEIRTLRALLSYVFDNLFIILVLVFQQEIRRGLSRFGQTPLFSLGAASVEASIVEEIIRAAVSLANRKIGALIVIENNADVLEFVESGTLVDAILDRDVLTSIFMPVSPLHDGAVIIRKGRLHMAGCFLPLTLNPSISKAVGTRHRAAVGLTEETDAICVVVSEENGSISLASQGKIAHNLEASQARKEILEALKK